MSGTLHNTPEGESGLGRDPVVEFEELVNLASGIAAYDERYDQVEAAAETATEYWAEFNALGEPAKKALARHLFAGERFRRLRFRADQIQRAFEAVGHPHFLQETARGDVQILREAILYLAGPAFRDHLARELFLCLPEYVAAGRRLEAAMVLHCALQTTNAQDQISPVLGVMFEFGFAEWLAEAEVQLVEILAWPDAWQFLLTPEEIEPWIRIYYARLEPAEAQFVAAMEEGVWATVRFRDTVDEEFARVTREMASVLLTGERKRQLVAAVEAYRDAQRQAGRNTVATHAGLLLVALKQPGSLEHTIATIAVCRTSMREALVKVGEKIRKAMENEEVGAMTNRHPERLDES